MKRYIVDYGMERLVRYAVAGCNTVQELESYLSKNPRPQYRLVSAQYTTSGNWVLVWELKKK